MQAGKISFETGHKIVHGKYHICHKIGEGQNCSVYSVSLKRKGKQIIRAIKTVRFKVKQQHEMVKHPQINNQIMVLKSIEEIPGSDLGFTKFYEYGLEADYNYMVMELLGPSLQQLLKLTGGKLSIKSVLLIGLQIIDRLEILHTAGWVYRDIQPGNFVMGLENKSPIVHMIDFGKCKRFKNSNGTHLPYKQNARFDGEIQFSSLNTHIKTEYSRRDDLEALINMMIYLRKGKLPWSIAKDLKTRKQRQTAIQQLKKKIPPQHLTYKMPQQFVDLITYVRTLNFFQKPDYDYIRTLLHRSFDPQQDNLNIVYDWSEMDHLDFAIYTGQPKIVQRYEQGDQQNEDEKQEINQSNSINVQRSVNKKHSRKENVKEKQEKENENENEKKSNLFEFLNNFQ